MVEKGNNGHMYSYRRRHGLGLTLRIIWQLIIGLSNFLNPVLVLLLNVIRNCMSVNHALYIKLVLNITSVVPVLSKLAGNSV